MKKLLEVLGVFIVGGVMAVIMNVAAQDAKPSADSIPEPTPQVASSPAASSNPYARNVICPDCGQGYHVAGKEPFAQIKCGCGATLNVAEDVGGSLAISSVEPLITDIAELIVDEPEKTPELAGPPPEIKWLDDLEAAKAESVRTGRPLLVVQTMSRGCVPCDDLKKYVFTDPRVVEYVNENYVPCLVVDRQMLAGMNLSNPAMWLRTPAGGGLLWYGPKHSIPKEPVAFIAALKKALTK